MDALKRYLITAIDLPTRFAFAYTYKSNSSASASDFLGKLKSVTPFEITRVQTDNGHEFLKHFIRACSEQNLVHFFNYPRHPQSNGHLERFNRTIQEQFAYWNTDSLDDTDVFNRLLMKYLLWYNTEKPHRSIGKFALCATMWIISSPIPENPICTGPLHIIDNSCCRIYNWLFKMRKSTPIMNKRRKT